MPRYGVVSIGRNHRPDRYREFEDFYQALGGNTGNLLFSNAVWRQLNGTNRRFGFAFDPGFVNERFDAMVFPAANWIHTNVDFTRTAEIVEQLKIPVVIIGLGAQSPDYHTEGRVSDTMLRFLKAAYERSASFSVRGEYTRKVLAKLGFSNVRVTGCPSLYEDFGASPPGQEPTPQQPFCLRQCLLHATRFGARHMALSNTPSADKDLFRFARAHTLDILFQSEPEEISLLSGFEQAGSFNRETRKQLLKIYGDSDFEALCAYITRHGKTFYNVDKWSEAITENYRFVYGTRLHGTIMALNSGVRALMLYHDSRTRELAEFAAIPSIDAAKADISQTGLRRAYEDLDLAPYYRRRTQNRVIYRAFLEENGLDATV